MPICAKGQGLVLSGGEIEDSIDDTLALSCSRRTGLLRIDDLSQCRLALLYLVDAGPSDGIRTDVDGNLWAGANWTGSLSASLTP